MKFDDAYMDQWIGSSEAQNQRFGQFPTDFNISGRIAASQQYFFISPIGYQFIDMKWGSVIP